MRTVKLTSDNARWERIMPEIYRDAVLQRLIVATAGSVYCTHEIDPHTHLVQVICDACSALGLDAIEPTDGPIAILKTGAKIYWSDSRGEACISGYACDGSDVTPYLHEA